MCREDLARMRARIAVLAIPMSHEMASLDRPDAAALIDPLIGSVARRLGALELAIGDGLAALEDGLRHARLGRSCIRDVAREDLGRFETQARRMAKLARALRDRPLLRAAVVAGEMSARQARTLLPVARGADEAAWVERGKALSARRLEKEVMAARAGAEPE
jgi:hypothetical protein